MTMDGTGYGLRKVILLILVIMQITLTSCSNGGASGTGSSGGSASPDESVTAGMITDPDFCRRAGEGVEVIDMRIGMWVAPRAHLMKTQEEADRRFAEIREAGINMYYSFYEEKDDAWLDRMLRAAEKNGVGVLISLDRVYSGSDIEKNLELARRTKDYSCVIGFNMYDEPSAEVNPLLSTQKIKLRALAGDGKILMCNLFPNYAPPAKLGIAEGVGGRTVYQTYLDRFMSEVGTDALSFDFYPFQANSSTDKDYLRNMLRNLSDIALSAKKNGVPAWGFIQDSSWDATRVPDDDELRFLSHAHLAFGLKSYSYFLYAQPSDKSGGEGIFKGMIDYDGNRTEIYDRVKKNNEEIAGMRGRFLDYGLEGFLTDNISSAYRSCIADELRLDGFGSLESVKTDRNLLIGCFRNGDGIAYYVMNFGYSAGGSATLTFGEGGCDITVWGSGGIEQTGHSDTVGFTLRAGEGKFIELKAYSDGR